MLQSINALYAKEGITKINAKVSKMTIAQAKVYLSAELEKWPSQINERLHQYNSVERSILQHIKELIFLINNQMQAPTAIHERERFRGQLAVVKKVYKNSLEPLPRIVMWKVEQVDGCGKKISMLGIEGVAYVN